MLIKLQLSQQLFYFRYPIGKHHKNRSARLVFRGNYPLSSFKNNQHSERRSIRLVSKSPAATKMQKAGISSTTVDRPSYQIVYNEKQQKKLCKYHANAAEQRQNLELHRSINHQPLDFLPLFSFSFGLRATIQHKSRRRIMRAISG